MNSDIVTLLREIRDEMRLTRESRQREFEEYMSDYRGQYEDWKKYREEWKSAQNRMAWMIVLAFALGSLATWVATLIL